MWFYLKLLLVWYLFIVWLFISEQNWDEKMEVLQQQAAITALVRPNTVQRRRHSEEAQTIFRARSVINKQTDANNQY